MASFTIRIRGIDELLSATILNETVRAKLLVRGLLAGGTVLEVGLKKRIPVRSGQTRSRITKRLSRGSNKVSVIVGGKSVSAGGFNVLKGLEEGTGLFGPKGQKIRPKKPGGVLRWVPSKPVSGTPTGEPIFRKWVRGMKPRRPFALTIQEDGKKAVKAVRRTIARGIIQGEAGL